MKTIERKTTYEVRGKDFESKKAAEQFEKLATARDVFESARDTYGRLLAETFTTADGEPFRFSNWHYWYIFKPFDSIPRLVEVSGLGYQTSVYPEEYSDDVSLRVHVPIDAWGVKRDDVTYPIDELYADLGKCASGVPSRLLGMAR